MPEKKKRRANNEGSIRKRKSGLWEAQYTVGYKENGKAIRRSLYASSKKEVREKLWEVLQQIMRDEYIEPSRLTTADWLDQWLATYCIPLKKASTCTGYEDEINLHIKPFIGDIPLQELRPQHVQSVVNGLVKQKKAPSTVCKAHAILHSALEQAVVNQMLLHNPSRRTILPKMEQKDIRFLSLAEQRAFIAALPEGTAGRALYFILGTGLRVEELSGLRWSDIHGNYFTIAQTIRRNRDFSDDAATRTTLESGTPKTKAGRRTIPLSPRMQELLLTQRREQLILRLAAGNSWIANDLVFCTDIGTPYEGRNLNRVLHRTLQEAGLDTMGVHSLRHTFATRAMEAGMDVRTLSEILGHAKVSLTLQLYAHSSMETKQKELEKMDSFL